MKAAGPQAKFMHCLPAERGIECTDGVVESGELAGWGGLLVVRRDGGADWGRCSGVLQRLAAAVVPSEQHEGRDVKH